MRNNEEKTTLRTINCSYATSSIFN